MPLNRDARHKIAAITGIAASSLILPAAPALAMPPRPAIILPSSLSAKAEMAGHRLSNRDYEFAMLMMVKMSGMLSSTPVPAVPGFVTSTWNPADKDPDVTLTNGNRSAATTTANRNVRGTVAATMKSYLEILVDTAVATMRLGLATSSTGLQAVISNVSTAISYSRFGGEIESNGVLLGTASTYTSGDRVMIAFDPTASKFWVGLNGTWNGNPAAGTGGYTAPAGPLFPIASAGAGGQATLVGLCTYVSPSGFSTWA